MRNKLASLIQEAYNGCAQRSSVSIADHLLANGVIVPPCKVGDTVYCIRYDKAGKPFVKPLGVLSVTAYYEGKFSVFTTRDDFWRVTAFPTREEAEKELERRRKG